MQKIAKAAKVTLKELVNTKSQTFKKLQPDLAAMGDDQVVNLIKSDPRILRRPVIIDDQGVLFGFAEAAYQERLG